MGIRGGSFELRLPQGPLAANAGLVTAFYGTFRITVMAGEREIPTKIVWGGSLSDEPDATLYSLVRPTTGDWPIGTMSVTARDWDSVVADCSVTVGPSIEGEPPSCGHVSDLIQLGAASFPGGGGRSASPGIAVTGLADPYGPLVSIAVDYTVNGAADVHVAERLADSNGGRTVPLPETIDELKRVRITNVIGKTRELLPPFPWGTAPAGPIGAWS